VVILVSSVVMDFHIGYTNFICTSLSVSSGCMNFCGGIRIKENDNDKSSKTDEKTMSPLNKLTD
jgi:hypothetical protein